MLSLRDYADGSWRFIAVCEGCGRESRVEPTDVLARSKRAHGGMVLDDVAGLLRCRESRRRGGHGSRGVGAARHGRRASGFLVGSDSGPVRSSRTP